jgi:hypothetical protein
MSRLLRHAARTAAALITPAALVRLGLPAVGAALLVVIVAAGVLCWVISNGDRSNRAARLISATRGDAVQMAGRPPDPPPTPARQPSPTRIRFRIARRGGVHHE